MKKYASLFTIGLAIVTLVWVLSIEGCKPTEPSPTEKLPITVSSYTYHGAEVETVVYDSCEYVKFGSNAHSWGGHKGNCKFCKERLEKLLKKIQNEKN